MKKVYLFALLVIMSVSANAKKVKFSVNMSGQVINTTGIHVAGDFQTIAGFAGGDWNSASTTLTQEIADTNIYSIVVDLPAFAKYEYKFVNGDQFYEAEFVPQESRVGYNFNDNRWLYIDSLSDDTTDIGALMFAGNAPAGKILVRYLVDMQLQPSINGNGVHIAGDFQGWDASKTILYSFGANIYEIICYYDTAAVAEYKFYNGNNSSQSEIIPTACSSVLGNRTVQANADIVLDAVCFNGCTACSTTGINSQVNHSGFSLFPNPAYEQVSISFSQSEGIKNILLCDVSGKVIVRFTSENERNFILPISGIGKGLYVVSVENQFNQSIQQTKLIIE
jgi:hypothetical protein